MSGRRHRRDEIDLKLAKADEMEAAGRSRRDIARALGVSTMTYYRWRSARDGIAPVQMVDQRLMPERAFTRKAVLSDLESLELENFSLRALLVDLLLENRRLARLLRATERIDARDVEERRDLSRREVVRPRTVGGP